jgi:hypothetical protein
MSRGFLAARTHAIRQELLFCWQTAQSADPGNGLERRASG